MRASHLSWALALGLGCRGQFHAAEDSTGTATTAGTSTSGSTGSGTETDGTETGPAGPIEPCTDCWSGWCATDDGACALGVFVTGELIPPDFGGLEGGDQRCRDAAGGDSFAAWLSLDGDAVDPGDDVDARDHVMLSDRIYVLPGADGVIVATRSDDFTVGPLQHSVDRLADGAPAPAPADPDIACASAGTWTVWTGTLESGTADGSNCSDWTCGPDPNACPQNGRAGRTDRTDGSWTESCNGPCDTSVAALYCFELPS